MNDLEFLTDLYSALLKRAPREPELTHWATKLAEGMADREIIARFIRSPEYRHKNRVRCTYPPGHYYSPIVDPDSLDKEKLSARSLSPSLIPGINIDGQKMLTFWNRNADTIAGTPFPIDAAPGFRYYSDNNIYPIGDATILRAMLADKRPVRMIEIGSGFSSACALDTADEFSLPTEFLFIEPYAKRLRSVLRPQDAERVSIVEKPVQEVSLDVFASLNGGDILLIDSTHVLKTGSDVHYELFKVLPVLKPGVYVHFHDIHYPFEYPSEWVFGKNLSWNEIYAVRAFLMHNNDYEIEFFNHYFTAAFTSVIGRTFPKFLANGGGSLWIKKVGPSLSV
ncbi:MAG: class I SAM-dependent methyltransferase [Alphaproteobacteria bacterium]|nr:class I SAM-dependent methyltransferase [Alphaproteobacteria bacterium]